MDQERSSASDPEPAREATAPFRRKVFYIPGYDPIPPRRYRELYRREGAAQAAISGYQLHLQPRQGGGAYGWRVGARIGGAEVEAEVEVLLWSDIVRQSMDQGIAATYLQLLRTAWAYIGSGALARLMRLRKGPMIAALYPIGVLLAQLALALLAGLGLFRLGAILHPALGLILGFGIIPLILRMFRRQDHRIYAYYLMHDYAYSAQSMGANPPALEARMAEFARRIASALAQPHDEVLVVGHSSGAHLAVSILSDMIRQGQIRQGQPTPAPALALLTLGQVVPMVSFLPEARRLRGDLAFLSRQEALTWVDVTAPGDGCAFALCDPVAVSGVAPEGKRWPLVISAAFSQTLSPARWKALRWRFFRLHFQYLCAFDQPGDYDYFQITAGPLTLGQRYHGRAASRSRIETPLSPWRSQ